MIKLNYRIELGTLLTELKLPRIVAEVGCAEGRFSQQILSWGIDHFYMIDNWGTIPNQSGDGGFNQAWHNKNYMEALQRVDLYKNKIEVLQGLSVAMASKIPDNSLGMVYIDCWHEYEGVKRDLEFYFPKVVSGGVVAGHDFLNMSYGVNRAVKEFCAGKFEISVIEDEEPSMASFYFIKP